MSILKSLYEETERSKIEFKKQYEINFKKVQYLEKKLDEENTKYKEICSEYRSEKDRLNFKYEEIKEINKDIEGKFKRLEY